MYDNLVTRFCTYVQINTTSSEETATTPSTPGQRGLALHLQKELESLGIEEVTLTDHCYLYAHIPGTDPHRAPLGLVAHLDTSPSVSGENVKPQIHQYKGGEIKNSAGQVIVNANTALAQYAGGQIITSDGTTLLGADNKAGIAEIVTAAEYLLRHRENLRYPDLYIAFVPDEEIGHQVKYIDTALFPCTTAFTIDGGAEGEIEYGCFNACKCVVHFPGRNIHPGYAEGRLVSAIETVSLFLATLFNKKISPNDAGEEDGFIHAVQISATEEDGEVVLIIRDFTEKGIDEKIAFIHAVIDQCNGHMERQYPDFTGEITCTVQEQYKNMEQEINKRAQLIEETLDAVRRAGVKPVLKKIRGGTDGSALSARGIACPNIFTGGHNFHATSEWISVSAMEKAVSSIIELVSKKK